MLTIHPGALGDVLLAVPALRALRAGAAALTIAAQPRIGALLVALGVVERAVAFEALGLEALFAGAPVAAEAPLARLVATAPRVVCWFGARDAAFTCGLRAVAPDAVVAASRSATKPVWEHLLESTGAVAPVHREPIAVTGALLDEGDRGLRALGWTSPSRVLVVHPGAGSVYKRWPVDGFVDAVTGVDATIVVHEGPADAEAVRDFLERVPIPVVRLADPPLPLLAGVLARATTYLGNDSGVSHLAAAVGAPSLILFSEAALPWVPWSPTAQVVRVTPGELRDEDRRAVRAALRTLQ